MHEVQNGRLLLLIGQGVVQNEGDMSKHVKSDMLTGLGELFSWRGQKTGRVKWITGLGEAGLGELGSVENIGDFVGDRKRWPG